MADYPPPIDFSLLWKKIHAELTPEEEAVFTRWHAESSRHRAYFKQLQTFYQAPQTSTGPNVEAAWEAVHRQLTPPQSTRRVAWRLVTGIAASLLMLVAAWHFWSNSSHPLTTGTEPVTVAPGTDRAQLMTETGARYDLSSGDTLHLMADGTRIQSEGTSLMYQQETAPDTPPGFNTLRVPRGGQFRLTLSDGTRVWLNAASTLRYPVYFSGSERNVTLTGEAYFEVSKDPARPFHVRANEQTIEVLGTAFNVAAYPDELTTTTLVEGKVNVFLTEEPEITTTLLPGYQSILIEDPVRLEPRRVDPALYTGWKDGTFVFVDQPLEAMMQTLARWYNVEVVFTRESTKKLSFTGEIERYQEFEKVLFLIEKTNEVSFTIQGRKVTVH